MPVEKALQLIKRRRERMKSVICPVCGAQVMLSFNATEGDIVTCQKCGARLRLIADGNGFRAAVVKQN